MQYWVSRHGGRTDRRLHTSLDCPGLKQARVARLVVEGTHPSLEVCKRCDGLTWSKNSEGHSTYDNCPFCGEEISRHYRDHLPCE